MHYVHRLGIVSQYIENVTMDKVKCAPRSGSGRLLAASVDIMHFSGCKGKILIGSCYFAEAQDDPVDVHGTNLRTIEKVDARIFRLRFMHGQSYGFNAYFKGDTMTFVRAAIVERFTRAIVRNIAWIPDRILEVRFDRDTPISVELSHDCIENMTCTPEVETRNSYFTRAGTRGTSVTTPRKVVVENNTYYKAGMNAILIKADAEGWYESGPVKDVRIKGSTFIDCAYNGGPGYVVTAIHPSNKVIGASHPVHQNIRIESNIFKTFDCPVFYAKSTVGLLFRNNTTTRARTFLAISDNPYVFCLNGCKSTMIESTVLEGEVLGRNIKTENMKRNYLETALK